MKIKLSILKHVIRETADEHSRKDELISIYSDVYKERYGSRPRGSYERLSSMSEEELEAELEALQDEPIFYDWNDWENDDKYEFMAPKLPEPHELDYYEPMAGTVSPDEMPEPFEELGDAPTKIPFKGGREYDALGGNPYLRSSMGRAGRGRKTAKTSYNRRLRRIG